MTGRHALLMGGGLAALAAAAGGFVLAERWRAADSAVWYGLRLGTAEREIPGSQRTNWEHSRLARVEPPWSEGLVMFDVDRRLVEIDLRDLGVEEEICEFEPCTRKRLKSVEQMRSDRERIRRELIARLGPPSTAERWLPGVEELVWDFVRPTVACAGAEPAPPATDPSGRLDSVRLHLDPDRIALDVRGRGWQEAYRAHQDPSIPIIPVPSPPAPPCAPSR